MSPPVGFRKAIPVSVKLKSVLRSDNKCPTCGERLGEIEGLEFDHVPALGLRSWNPETNDTEPPANDPGHIIPKHIDCHAQKTTGRKGESKISKVGGDTSEIAKLRRLSRKEEDFRKRMLAKADDESPVTEAKKHKTAWPKRKFPSKKV